METSDKELPVFGIIIKRNDDKIWMDIYFKPTENCAFPICPAIRTIKGKPKKI